MNREAVERELREKLKPLAEEGFQALIIAATDECVSALLPWVMEMREDAAMRERIEGGELP